MANMKWTGLDAYASQLTRLRDKAEGMIKRAVYKGAEVIGDAVRSEIEALPEQTENPPRGQQMNGVFGYEKDGLLAGVGLSKMQNEDGYINTKLGFTGYNRLMSKTYPNGHPNALIARAVNSGSSVRRRIPFITNAVRSAKAKAEEAMRAQLDADLKNETN